MGGGVGGGVSACVSGADGLEKKREGERAEIKRKAAERRRGRVGKRNFPTLKPFGAKRGLRARSKDRMSADGGKNASTGIRGATAHGKREGRGENSTEKTYLKETESVVALASFFVVL